MIKVSCITRMLSCVSLLFFFSAHAATRTVLNLLDNGSPGSLRETIAAADSGDTIVFAPSGTIFLDDTKGELVIDKSITINGEDKIVIDGQNKITTGFHVLAGDYDVSFLSLTIQHFSDEHTIESSKDVHGILVDDKITQCIVDNCTIQKLASTNMNGEDLSGIQVFADVITVTGNHITQLQGGLVPQHNSGSVRVISLRGFVEADCSGNEISYCFSSESENDSAVIDGLTVESLIAQKSRVVGNTVHHCWSGDAAERSGAIVGITARVRSGEQLFSDNHVSDCWTGIAQNSGVAFLINCSFLKGIASRNSASFCCSGKSTQLSGLIRGINVQGAEGVVFGNVVESLSTGRSDSVSGELQGIIISIGIPVAGAFSLQNNRVHALSTGDAQESGFVIGIDSQRAVCPLGGNPIDITHNNITTLCSGSASRRGSAIGIIASNVCDNSAVRCNVIKSLSGGDGAGERESITSGITLGVRGILLGEGDNITVVGNTICEVFGESGAFTSGMQLGAITEGGAKFSITNSLVSNNTIKDISNVATGYGIAVLTEGSYGNSLLSNSIFNTSGKAINIVDNVVDGEDASATPDAIVELSTVTCIGGKKIRVSGFIEPQAGLLGNPFLLQFFVSDSSLPSQAKTLIFEYTLEPSAGNTFDLTFVPAVAINSGQYVSATATAQVIPPMHNWNTSEVSNAVFACNSAGASYLKFVCPDKSEQPEPLNCDLLRDCLLGTNSAIVDSIL